MLSGILLAAALFVRSGSLLFSGTQHGVRGPRAIVRDRAIFFARDPIRGKVSKNGPKIGFCAFCRIYVVRFDQNRCNIEVLCFAPSAKMPISKNFNLQVIGRNFFI